MSPFVKITPTARNAPPRVLLNAHHIHRLQEEQQRRPRRPHERANTVERIPVAEPSFAIAHSMKADGNAGKITLHECMERRPTHQTSFDIADIRAVEPSDPGSIIRFGIDGSGKIEVFEDFETVANMIVSLEPLVTAQTAKLKIQQKQRYHRAERPDLKTPQYSQKKEPPRRKPCSTSAKSKVGPNREVYAK